MKRTVQARIGNHDEIYNEAYYRERQVTAAQSSRIIAGHIVREWDPDSALDVGCATGDLLYSLRMRGVHTLAGLDHASVAVEACRRKGLAVRQFDIEADEYDGGAFEVAVSTEVAEHLPAKCAEKLVDLLTGTGGNVVFTAATPGQGGTDHVNEQPHDYWIHKFETQGYALNESKTAAWRASLAEAGVAWWYSANMMIFERVKAG